MNQENNQEVQKEHTAIPASDTVGQGQDKQSPDTQALELRVTELETLVLQYKDQLLRKAAEFENYKKRIENDFLERVKFANEELVLDLLPVIDDFERSLKSGKEKKDFDVLVRGIELINQKMLKVLERNGVLPYTSIGQPFDPHLHDALLQVPRTDLAPHTVVEEVEKGYTMRGKVLRHSKVIVTAEHSEERTGEQITETNQTENQG